MKQFFTGNTVEKYVVFMGVHSSFFVIQQVFTKAKSTISSAVVYKDKESSKF